MAKRKYTDDEPKSLDSQEHEDATVPDMGESELIATVDQHEAEMRGEANPPPSPEEAQVETPTAPEGDGKPRVELRVFIASGGIRWDQMAGFKAHAKRQKMGPLSIPEWREAFNSFMKRPVR